MRDVQARLGEIYARHAAGVFRRACALLGDEAEAHEILQEIFMSLLERPAQFSGRSAMTTFLYSATTHACLNRLRNQRNRARLLRQHAPLPAPDSGSDPDRLVRIRQALERLPSPLAEVAVYYFVDELSQQEIADILNCSRRHVGHLIERLATWGRSQEDACSAE